MFTIATRLARSIPTILVYAAGVLLATSCARYAPPALESAAAKPSPGHQADTPAPAVAELANPNVRFGFPAAAQKDPSSRKAYLMERPQYTLSYNGETRDPNWVCWRLRLADIGNTPRS